MGESGSSQATGELQFDWSDARDFLARRLSRRLLREDQATLDDLTQEALVRLLRAARRETLENVEAFMERVAERTMIDFLRRRRIWQQQPNLDAAELADDPRLGFLPPDQFVPTIERTRFIVLEFFAQKNSGCAELARHYFESRSWLEVAGILGRPHTAIRQQWCRCVELLRASARAGSTWFLEWA